MGRTLILVRHAKSSWKHEGLSDFERPLNNRGFKNAPEMGRRLVDENLSVETIISSPALRAITTAKLIADEMAFNIRKIEQNEQIYEASLTTLIDLVSGLDNNSHRVMLVGHNPGLTVLCNYLSDARIDNMPTCSIAQIHFDIDRWDSISEHAGRLVDFDYPKKY